MQRRPPSLGGKGYPEDNDRGLLESCEVEADLEICTFGVIEKSGSRSVSSRLIS